MYVMAGNAKTHNSNNVKSKKVKCMRRCFNFPTRLGWYPLKLCHPAQLNSPPFDSMSFHPLAGIQYSPLLLPPSLSPAPIFCSNIWLVNATRAKSLPVRRLRLYGEQRNDNKCDI